MMHDDIIAFTEIMTLTSTAFGKNLTTELIKIYFYDLQAYELDEIKSAFDRYRRYADNSSFFPKIGDIVKIIEGSSESLASVAWGKLLSCSVYESYVFDDHLIHAVVSQMGGLYAIFGETLEQDLIFKQREFEKLYRIYRLHPPTTYPLVVIGLAQQHNSAGGFVNSIKPPRLVGNVEKAQAVMAGKYIINYDKNTSSSAENYQLPGFVSKNNNNNEKIGVSDGVNFNNYGKVIP